MYVRQVRFTLGSGNHTAAQELANQLIPAIRDLSGCRSATFFGDEASGEYGLVVLWESREEADAASAVIGPRLQQGLSGIAQGPPDIRLFEAMEPTA